MKRRIALQRVSLLMGGALSAGTVMAVLGGCQSEEKSAVAGELFDSSDLELIGDVAETIIPATSTPGAKEAGVAAFIGMMLKDCYPAAQQDHFKNGLAKLSEESKKLGGAFNALTEEQRISVLKTMESNAIAESQEAKAKVIDAESGLEKQDAKDMAQLTPFFQLMKELTLFGYFSSEIGCKEALAYDPIPKAYNGCMDLQPGQKAWAL